MPIEEYYGSMKVSSLVLQGHGDYMREDITLKVNNNAFCVLMGDSTLITLSKESDTVKDNIVVTQTNLDVTSKLTIGQTLKIGKYEFTESKLDSLFVALGAIGISYETL